MTADLVYQGHFSDLSVKSLFAFAWKNWFSTKREISYTSLKKQILLNENSFL